MARGPLYSFSEDRILLDRSDLTLKQMGVLIGRTEISVKNRRVRLIAAGLDDPRYRDYTDEEATFVMQHPEMNLADIGVQLRRSKSSIATLRHMLIRAGHIAKRTTRTRRVAPDPVQWTILNAPASESNRDVAARLGIKPGVVQEVRAHGWSCRIFIVPCAECGTLVTKRSLPPRVICAACHSAIRARINRTSRVKATTVPPVPPVERPWTDDEDVRLREAYRTMSANRIAAEFGRSANGIYKRALRLGLTRAADPERDYAIDQAHQMATERHAGHHFARWTDADDAYLIAHADAPDHEIAAHLGRTLWAVRSRTGKLRATGRVP